MGQASNKLKNYIKYLSPKGKSESGSRALLQRPVPNCLNSCLNLSKFPNWEVAACELRHESRPSWVTSWGQVGAKFFIFETP